MIFHLVTSPISVSEILNVDDLFLCFAGMVPTGTSQFPGIRFRFFTSTDEEQNGTKASTKKGPIGPKNEYIIIQDDNRNLPMFFPVTLQYNQHMLAMDIPQKIASHVGSAAANR